MPVNKIWLFIKSIEFADNPSFTPSKVNHCLPDRNKCDYSRPEEISYSSKTWFPECLFIKINFKKQLKSCKPDKVDQPLEPLILAHPLYLKERGSFDTYAVKVIKTEVNTTLEAKDMRKLSKRKGSAKSRSRRRW